MDNLKIQLTPLEVTYQTKEPLPLSCVLKKLLEKREIKSNPNISAGRVHFTESTTFALSKEMQLTNTKISMHFMTKKDRNISCIGSAELDIAMIPNQPVSLIELKLNNCNDPGGRLKLQIQRKDQNIDMKKDKYKTQNMGSLETQGLQKQSFLTNRRTNLNMPTAYEISRRNYKQAEIVRDQKNSDSRKHSSNGSIKGSYQKKFQTATAMGNNSKSKSKRNEPIKSQQELPLPRQRTPEPISIEGSRKSGCIVNNAVDTGRYLIAGRPNNGQGFKISKGAGTRVQEESFQEPSKLMTRPYQQNKYLTQRENDQNICDNSYDKLQQQKSSKYRLITEKLQMIHDKIVTGQSREVTEINQSVRSSHDKPSHHSVSDQVNSSITINTHGKVQTSCNEIDRRQTSMYQKPHSHSDTFKPFITDSQSRRQENLLDDEQRNLNNLSSNSLEFKEESVNRRIQHRRQDKSQNKFANIPGLIMDNEWHENSPKSTLKTSPDETQKSKIEIQSKKQLTELQKQNHEIIKQNTSFLEQIQDYKKQVAQLKSELSRNIQLLKTKDEEINQLTTRIKQSERSLIQKQTLLNKITKDYDAKFDQLQELKQRMAEMQSRSQGSIIDKIKESTEEVKRVHRQSDESERAMIQQQLLQTKKKMSELEILLKSRDNDIKLFKIDMDNLKIEKRSLEQQIQSFYKKNFKEISRERSIALIQEASNTNTNLILQNTRRQNEALKQQIKMLQQNKQALMRQLQSYKFSTSETKIASENRTEWQSKYQQRIVCLQERCRLLQQQLKSKKNLMAEMVNIIWNHGDPDIMGDITQLMGE